MAASTVYSHKELHGKNGNEKQEMLFQKGINYNGYPRFFKEGTFLRKIRKLMPYSPDELDKLPAKHQARTNPDLVIERSEIEEIDWNGLKFEQTTNLIDVLFNGGKPNDQR
jgi:tRNA(His) guanylyltransferase